MNDFPDINQSKIDLAKKIAKEILPICEMTGINPQKKLYITKKFYE